jgi:hypothetical protein
MISTKYSVLLNEWMSADVMSSSLSWDPAFVCLNATKRITVFSLLSRDFGCQIKMPWPSSEFKMTAADSLELPTLSAPRSRREKQVYYSGASRGSSMMTGWKETACHRREYFIYLFIYSSFIV